MEITQVLSSLNIIATKIHESKAIRFALEDELDINYEKFQSWWSFANREIESGSQNSRSFKVDKGIKTLILDANTPRWNTNVWFNNTAMFAIHLDRSTFRGLSKLYTLLGEITDKYHDLQLMDKKDFWNTEGDLKMVDAIWRDISKIFKVIEHLFRMLISSKFDLDKVDFEDELMARF